LLIFAVFIIGIKCLVTKTEFKQLIPLLGPKYFTSSQLKVTVSVAVMRSQGSITICKIHGSIKRNQYKFRNWQ